MTSALRDVIRKGTGTAAALDRPAAGKTGTTEEYRDAWFCGFVPQLAACVRIGYWSFVHLDDAAAATVLAVERAAHGIFNIVDDDPAPVREWLPALAGAIGAKPPRRVPRWLARVLAGEVGVVLTTETRGACNAKAKRELGWELAYPSWRNRFRRAYASALSGRRSRPPRSRPATAGR